MVYANAREDVTNVERSIAEAKTYQRRADTDTFFPDLSVFLDQIKRNCSLPNNICDAIIESCTNSKLRDILASDSENQALNLKAETEKLRISGWYVRPEDLQNTFSQNLRDNLHEKIWNLYHYGHTLDIKGISKGKIIMNMADALRTRTNIFFEQEPQQRNFYEFKQELLKLIANKKNDFGNYRTNVKTIMNNIAIALTVIGVPFIVGKLIYSKVTEGRPLFFFQKKTTTSEEKLMDICQSLSAIETPVARL